MYPHAQHLESTVHASRAGEQAQLEFETIHPWSFLSPKEYPTSSNSFPEPLKFDCSLPRIPWHINSLHARRKHTQIAHDTPSSLQLANQHEMPDERVAERDANLPYSHLAPSVQPFPSGSSTLCSSVLAGASNPTGAETRPSLLSSRKGMYTLGPERTHQNVARPIPISDHLDEENVSIVPHFPDLTRRLEGIIFDINQAKAALENIPWLLEELLKKKKELLDAHSVIETVLGPNLSDLSLSDSHIQRAPRSYDDFVKMIYKDCKHLVPYIDDLSETENYATPSKSRNDRYCKIGRPVGKSPLRIHDGDDPKNNLCSKHKESGFVEQVSQNRMHDPWKCDTLRAAQTEALRSKTSETAVKMVHMRLTGEDLGDSSRGRRDSAREGQFVKLVQYRALERLA
ncbi:hypothetical protein K504DRAFT_451917 [Pleomassaria siparia CBS 279.74]|uniref:Uncharacterized protein n=1 Tax=Pleomassaria siparia CBS 279.74 TaxID=1314801 RepID=A0A6G1JSE2_9PLEO|nr:hypothetical protein K504DRAFT_451917 [Pleomassaria siparia CBS 279.74]